MIRVLIYFYLVSFAFSTHASDIGSGPEQEVVDKCGAIMEPFDQFLEQNYSAFSDNIGIRGFVTSKYPPGGIHRTQALKYGYQWWYTPIYIVSSKAEAIEKSRQFARLLQDNFLVGLYLIGNASELGVQPSKDGTLVPEAGLKKLLSRGVIDITYLGDDGKQTEEPRVIERTGDELASKIDFENHPAKFFSGNVRMYDMDHLQLPGYHSGKIRGMIPHAEVLKSERTRNNKRLYAKLFDRGYRIVMDPSDPAILDDAMEVLANTKRYKRVPQIVNGKEKMVDVALPLEINRHRDEKVMNDFRESYGAGKSYLAVLLNPEVKVVGGELGFVDNMVGDSIFYDEERSRGLPEHTTSSQIAMVDVVTDAENQGLAYSTSGPMVSQYAANTGTLVVPLPEAMVMLEQNKQDRSKHGRNRIWNPYEGKEAELREQLEWVSKKFENSIGNAKFLDSRPQPNEITARVAAEFGLVQSHLYIELVSSFQAARESAKKHPTSAPATIYIVLGDKPLAPNLRAFEVIDTLLGQKTVPPAAAQKKMVDEGVIPTNMQVAQVFSFRKPGEAKDVRFYDFGALAKRLHLGDYPAAFWDQTAGHEGRIVIPGWALRP